METQANHRLLVVDDDRKLAGLIRDYLTPMGYQVELRHNGPDGLAEALAAPYVAVILDVMMPGETGFALTRAVRAASKLERRDLRPRPRSHRSRSGSARCSTPPGVRGF